MRTVYLTLVGIVILSLSCESAKNTTTKNTANEEIKAEIAENVEAEKFKEFISENAIILDVRTPDEYNAGHLENAVNINFFDADFMDQVLKLDKSKSLLIYCASGGRSSKAMNRLKGKGYSVMYNLLGGFSAWSSSGFSIAK